MAMAYSVGAGLGLIFSGLVAKEISISVAWMLSGLVLVLFTLLFTKNNNNSKEKAVA
ncbi:hypothetical protein GQ568_02970 [Patescibacteria group bacterium]|nr:hypothetical protein [Patescibacteria group bacterium]